MTDGETPRVSNLKGCQFLGDQQSRCLKVGGVRVDVVAVKTVKI